MRVWEEGGKGGVWWGCLFYHRRHQPTPTPTHAQADPGTATVAVVAAFGYFLPRTLLESLPVPALNIHPSALPRWRGAAPIRHTLMAGDPTTAVSLITVDPCV